MAEGDPQHFFGARNEDGREEGEVNEAEDGNGVCVGGEELTPGVVSMVVHGTSLSLSLND